MESPLIRPWYRMITFFPFISTVEVKLNEPLQPHQEYMPSYIAQILLLCQVPNRSQKVREWFPATFQAACLNCITVDPLRLFRNVSASSLCYNNTL